jgi:hypothetical protein
MLKAATQRREIVPLVNPAIKKIDTLLSEVHSGEDLREIGRMLNRRHSEIQRSAIQNFSIGDPVVFEGKHGIEYSGTVIRINTKRVSVKTPGGQTWRVSPTLLKKL